MQPSRIFWFVSLAAALALSGALAGAPAPIALPVNGHFRGAPERYSPAPGWFLTPDGGGARVLPTPAPDQFVLELQATPQRAQGIVSDFLEVSGGVLECVFTISGSGVAFIHFDVYGEQRAHLFTAEPSDCRLGEAPRVFSFTAPMAPRVRFVRLRMAAAAGCVARFQNVSATIRHDLPAQPPAPAKPAAPAAPEPVFVAAPPVPAAEAAAPFALEPPRRPAPAASLP